MDQNGKKKQMQDDGRSGVLCAASRCCDWFADRFDVVISAVDAG
jgi:hypothetical protein